MAFVQTPFSSWLFTSSTTHDSTQWSYKIYAGGTMVPICCSFVKVNSYMRILREPKEDLSMHRKQRRKASRIISHAIHYHAPLCGDLAWTDDLVIAYYSSFPDPDTLSAGNILILIYWVSLIHWSWKRFGSKHKQRSFSQTMGKENLSWFRYWCVHPVEARFL